MNEALTVNRIMDILKLTSYRLSEINYDKIKDVKVDKYSKMAFLLLLIFKFKIFKVQDSKKKKVILPSLC